MASPSAEERFNTTVDIIKSLPKTGIVQPSNNTKLKFYSYYKQATEGPCEISKPGFWDIVNRAKWDAWNKLGNMSKEEAMNSYVAAFGEVLLQHSLDELEDPDEINSYLEKFEPILDIIPKEFHANYFALRDKAKASFNNNAEDHLEKEYIKAFPENSSVRHSVPLNGHNVNGNTESDSDEFSDTLERVNEDEPVETSISVKPVNNKNPGRVAKGPNIVNVRGGGDHRVGMGDSNSSSGGPSGSRGNRQSQQPRGSDYPLSLGTNNSLIGGAGGSRRSGGDGFSELSSDIVQQLAMAVIRMQHTMEQVVVRLENLETLITQGNAKTASLPVSIRNQSRWSIFGISPKLAFIILAWPFIAQWLMYVIRKRQRQLH